MNFHIRYHGPLRDRRGEPTEVFNSDAATPAGLFADLESRYAFGINATVVQATVNGAPVPLDHPLRDGDEVEFTSP